MDLSKIGGMLAGCFLGDALGAPHEFLVNKDIPYTGKLEHSAFLISRFHGKKELSIGQVTDDSEMTLALLRQMIVDNGYIKNNVILAYLKWANSGGWMIGNNTRSLLRGVKTIKGYEKRIAKINQLPIGEISQSNGFMMRASPLALLSDDQWERVVQDDVNITNPHPVCIDCNLIYVGLLRMALGNHDRQSMFQLSYKNIRTPEVKYVFDQVIRQEHRDITDKKGWCLHALWCTLVCLRYFDNYQDGINWVIRQKGDTDTNACIAGGLLGALCGYNKMIENPLTNYNISVLLSFKSDDTNNPTKRPKEYSPHDLYDLTMKAYTLTL